MTANDDNRSTIINDEEQKNNRQKQICHTGKRESPICK